MIPSHCWFMGPMPIWNESRLPVCWPSYRNKFILMNGGLSLRSNSLLNFRLTSSILASTRVINVNCIIVLYRNKPFPFCLVLLSLFLSKKMSHRVAVYRTAHFNAAHRLHVPSWTDAENQAFFGLCNNAHYHGHNYDLEVRVEGEVDSVTGYLIDMKLIKQYIEEEVIERFDHKNLNLDTEEFRDLNPTAENIVWVIWQKLRARVPQEMNLGVRLYETPRNFVEFNG